MAITQDQARREITQICELRLCVVSLFTLKLNKKAAFYTENKLNCGNKAGLARKSESDCH